MQASDPFTGGAEHQGPGGFEVAQHIDHGALDLVRGHPNGAVFDVPVGLVAAGGVDPHGVALIDLYAGSGVFSLGAAVAKGARVRAVEGDRVSAADLIANAAVSENVQPFEQPVEDFLSASPKAADVLVVDPPRTGMSREALDGVIRLRAPRIVYVSCDVATLARDARRLVDAGYSIERTDAFDLFPNTPHVETVVVFVTSRM